MRICLISREYPPDTGFGGIATFANHLAHGLIELGHHVEVVALAKDVSKSLKQDGVTVHRVDANEISKNLSILPTSMPCSRFLLCNSIALWKKFLELHERNNFDVVDTPELLAEGLIPSITKIAPLLIRLYTPHSKFIAERFHNVTPSFDHQFAAMLERVAMLQADVITSPSDDLADYVAHDIGIDRSAIYSVRNPIDIDTFNPVGKRALEEDGRSTVLFVGRLEERKGINYLVEAIPKTLKAYPRAKFVIIGDDTNTGREQKSVLAEIRRSLKKSGCEQDVQFIARVALNDLPNYYRSADICIVPSVYDNSPYTCLEAMACGRAVIGTSAGGTREYIVHGQSGLIIPPRDSDAITNALIDLLQDVNERKRLGANARLRVVEKFQRTEIAKQTTELYRLAISHFRSANERRMYLKPPDHFSSDARQLLYSFDSAMYDFVYNRSLEFRMRHWARLFAKRPKLAAAKVFLNATNQIFRIIGLSSLKSVSTIHNLEELILQSQFPNEERQFIVNRKQVLER